MSNPIAESKTQKLTVTFNYKEGECEFEPKPDAGEAPEEGCDPLDQGINPDLLMHIEHMNDCAHPKVNRAPRIRFHYADQELEIIEPGTLTRDQVECVLAHLEEFRAIQPD